MVLTCSYMDVTGTDTFITLIASGGKALNAYFVPSFVLIDFDEENMRTTMAKTTLLKQHWCNVLVLVSIAVKITAGEDPRPEIFIPAKNFNPHPYELAAQTGERNGPVLFPPNPEDNLVESRSNFVTLTNFPNRDSHPVDSHPYAKVARKHKYRVIGRFDDEDPRVNEHARKALAKHAAQVLSYPPEKLAKYKTVSEQQGKDYAFSYKVVDRLRGDDFSHSQTRNSKATSGEYRVKLPDGRVQIVSYTADKNGYKADVKYTEDEGVTDQRGGGPRQGW
ncbi:hypothetical protein NQ315_004111 [Exocentrus adspersus]|uniref:Uncharacterized protein n=1 Tax=Exocentrus adspersus TaxID=1586481 RepID=A0AAV8W7N8_9CUCU|nr:hypothetical protein NQ315_004111 [Exocentrus adspersus]